MLLLLVIVAACHSPANNNAAGIVVINSPATGEVTRVLTAEGVHLERGTPIIEIAVVNGISAATPTPVDSAEAQAGRNYKAADAEIDAARAEVVRHQAEIGRLAPLVASGQASQGELDGERAQVERAQRRLQQAQDAKRQAESGLIAARQPGANRESPTQTESRRQTVSAVTTAAGTVAVISARVGDRVKLGQPLATLRADR